MKASQALEVGSIPIARSIGYLPGTHVPGFVFTAAHRFAAEGGNVVNQSIYLETARLRIRDHISDDLPTHHLLLTDEKVMYYLQDIKSATQEDSARNLADAMCEIGDERRSRFFFRIEDKETAAHIGEIGYTVSAWTPFGSIAEVGYFIYDAYWGKGYVTEALRAVMDFAFSRGGVFRMIAGCIKENGGSERVMCKCGMTKEGDFKQCTLHDGQLKDRVAYRMLRDEWLSLAAQATPRG